MISCGGGSEAVGGGSEAVGGSKAAVGGWRCALAVLCGKSCLCRFLGGVLR